MTKPLADILRDIVNGQRAHAEHCEELGDIDAWHGDLAGAVAHWDAADRYRRQARSTLSELVALERARWDSPAHKAFQESLAECNRADRESQAAHVAAQQRKAEERVVEARKAAGGKGRAA